MVAMSNAEFLSRIDRHMERIDHHLGRGNELMQQNRAAIEQNREVTERVIQEFELNRDAADRNSKLMDQMVDRHERYSRKMVETLSNLSEDVKAQTAATWRMLDRIPPLDGENA